MKKTKFPLSYKTIGKMLGKEHEFNSEMEGIFMIKKSALSDPEKLDLAISKEVFKLVYDDWENDRDPSSDADPYHLLLGAAVTGCEIKEQSDAVAGFVVVRAKINVQMKSDPGAAAELREEMKEAKKLSKALEIIARSKSPYR